MEHQTINSGSLEQTIPPHDHISPEEKNITSIKNELIKLKEIVNAIQTNQLAKELKLSESVIESSGEIKSVKRTKFGKGAIPLLESEIREAQAKTSSANEASKYLKVSYLTYKKYAKLYGIWKTNLTYRGVDRRMGVEVGKFPLSRILQGEFPNFPVYKLKYKLIQGGVKKPECEQCGYREPRITDGKLPLLLNFEDGNAKNHRLENIKLLCYNCTFCSGKGYIRRGRKYHALEDPDRAQGSNVYISKLL